MGGTIVALVMKVLREKKKNENLLHETCELCGKLGFISLMLILFSIHESTALLNSPVTYSIEEQTHNGSDKHTKEE